MCVQKMMRRWMLLFEAIETFDVALLDPTFIAELANQGFDTTEVLYHGSNENFSQFAPRRRSRMIFTSPDAHTAGYYGRIIYACFGRQTPQANLTPEDMDYKLLKKVVAGLADSYIDHIEDDRELQKLRERIAQRLHHDDPYATEWSDSSDYESEAKESMEYQAAAHHAAEEYLTHLIMSGSDEMSGTKLGSSVQTDVLTECFALRYTSVRFADKSYSGAWESIAFDNSDNLVILGRVRGHDALY